MERLPESTPPANAWTQHGVAKVAAALDGSPLDDVLRWGFDAFGAGIVLATSFGPQSIVLMHRIAELRPETTVFYLDTDLLFPETYALRDELATRLGLEFVRVATELSVEEQAAQHGPRLWARDPDACCALRKVLPLRRFLADKQAWITGIRNGHSKTRAKAPLVEWDEANGAVKLNPLIRWSSAEVRRYLEEHELPSNPLHARGFPSIGCQPCTRAIRPGEDPRSGRWPGFGKTECGIHRTASDLIRIGDSIGDSAS